MSESPWSAYGRLPAKPDAGSEQKQDPVREVVAEAMRGRERLENYLHGVLREFFEIRSGNTGYRQIIADALSPSTRPESIEEQLTRLAREAQTRRSARSPRTGAR
ncbi:MAG TPA: hypothetical protein VGO08_15380 [Burkholderiales bacterium]|jgi:hypothetical protein|nr:hypothetical protein [Burkholderiales bacterium]